ncbi:MAG: FAD-dependent oxidoreductase [Flavobacteriaceae bacterium]
MRKVDYIIVGLGLAGLAFTRELEKNNKSFIVFEDDSQHSSKVAGGMYNPVILKRFTPVWDAKKQLEIALPFYKEMEEKFGATYNIPMDIGRLLTSIEEQNNWFATCDHPLLEDYMIPKIETKTYNGVESPFGYGKLTKTGRIDAKSLLNDYRNYLVEKECIYFEVFNHEVIQFENDVTKYKDVEAAKIVFCEGFGIRKNPFFNYLPMREAKGELITIHAPELDIDFVLKSAVFILPLGEHKFLVGATFNWKDKTNNPSEEGKNELVEKLNKIIKVDYKVIDQVAGIRPTVKDRRPLIGIHPKHPQLAILNGLGTRGVMIAPTVSKELYNHLENKETLRKEINISRFG